MNWKVSADVERYSEAVDHFLARTVVSDADRASIPAESRSKAFWVAGAAQLSVVQHVHDEAAKAIANGTPFEDFKKAVSSELTSAWGKENPARIETIFRNAAQTSYNAGRYAQMTEPSVLKFRPYWMYDAVLDTRTSPECRTLNGTLLPADDPWWDTHIPPLHHRCRSGIRNLRVAEAEKIGPNETPPDVAAPEGWGLSPKLATEWKPDPKGKEPALVTSLNTKVKQLEALPAPPAIGSAIREHAQEFADALELTDGGKRARELLRQQVQEVFPGAIARNIGADAEEFLAADADLDPHLKHALAYYLPNGSGGAGRLVAREEVRAGAQDAAALLSEGKFSGRLEDSGGAKNDAASQLRVLLHEELHGHSAVSVQSYHGLGQVLEEVGTELSARRAVIHVLPEATKLNQINYDAAVGGAYQGLINSVVGSVQHATGLNRVDAIDLVIDAHHVGVLSRPGHFASQVQAERGFFDALAVTPKQRQAIEAALRKAGLRANG